MTGQNGSDEQLARLLRDTVDDITPQHGLDAIRSRTSSPPKFSTDPKESTMSVARTWLLGGLGGAVATAAVIGGVWFASSSLDNDDPNPGPATSPTSTATATDSVSPSSTPSSGQQGTLKAVPAYYVGETPSGLRLYREFRSEDVSGDSEAELPRAGVCAAALGSPADPDYATYWSKAGLVGCNASWNNDVVTIDLSTNDAAALHDGTKISADQRAISIQQLIFTAQAALGKGRVPVQFLINGKHSDQVLGQPASEPLANAPVLDTLAHVNLTTPAQGAVITGDNLEVSGVANSFEANVVIRLQRYEGTYIAFEKPLTAEGWMGEKLFPFAGTFDISGVAPGKYTVHAMTDDPSGGAEGNGPFSDTKVITIK